MIVPKFLGRLLPPLPPLPPPPPRYASALHCSYPTPIAMLLSDNFMIMLYILLSLKKNNNMLSLELEVHGSTYRISAKL